MKKSELFLSVVLAVAVFFLCAFMASLLAPSDYKTNPAAAAKT